MGGEDRKNGLYIPQATILEILDCAFGSIGILESRQAMGL